jgi:signal transduction histidine kinase
LKRTADPEGAALDIRDTGSGMKKEVLQKVFEPFYTTRERGTGLGLAIVRRIVENQGGRIQLESEPGRGTVVAVWLSTSPRKESITAHAVSEVEE